MSRSNSRGRSTSRARSTSRDTRTPYQKAIDKAVFQNAFDQGVYGKRSVVKYIQPSLINNALMKQAQPKLYQQHYSAILKHNVVYYMQKNTYSLVTQGTGNNQRQGEHIFFGKCGRTYLLYTYT